MSRPVVGAVPAPDLHVMTLNIRRPVPGWRRADSWRDRAPRLTALLQSERPSLLGVQEAVPAQAAVIGAALGGRHRFVGHGRQPGPRGEGCPVFYDSERLELLAWRQAALSDRPDEPGSTSWGNVIPRVYVQLTLRDPATSAVFTVVNTHLDAFSPRARLRAAEELRRLAAESPLPVVLLGDLNAGPASPPFRTLLEGRTLDDAWVAAEERLTPEWATYARYRQPRRGRRIDALFVSPDVRVRRVAINAHRFDGGWPSDHLPVQAVLRLPTSTPPAGRGRETA